jgi:hypothetical protein
MHPLIKRTLSARIALALCVVLAIPLAAARAQGTRTVFVGGNDLEDEQLVAFTTAVAGSSPLNVVLLDTPKASPFLKATLKGLEPDRVIPVGSFPAGPTSLEQRLGRKTAPALEWQDGHPVGLWKHLFPRAEQVVVCPAKPRGLLLQAACLAGSLDAPLYVLQDRAEDRDELGRWLGQWHTHHVLAAGGAVDLCQHLGDLRVVPLADEEAVAAAHRRHLLKAGSIKTVVVANPADLAPKQGGMSVLAPWVAVQRRAALLLTNDKGDDATALLRTALKQADFQNADALILVANLRAIPMERRINPVPGKDTHIEMEPLTPKDYEPFTLATGRLFHEDLGILPLMLARQHLLQPERTSRQAMIVSNPGGGLPLLELFSRNTAKELQNVGYDTTTFFGRESHTKDQVRRLLPEQDVFLWEGHYRTMIDEYQLPFWTEPLRPSLVFLQSCLALNEAEAPLLLQRGAIAAVGSSTRTYSGTGGALTLAFFDAVFYGDQTLGGALRQAKNYLLAYALLKEKRLGEAARLHGASLRSAWAFTIWGDPTVRLPAPQPPADALAPVRHEVRGSSIYLSLPEMQHPKAVTNGFQAQMLPNGRLAGLLTRPDDEDERQLVPLLFAEVHLPKAPKDKTPRLRSRLPERNWEFLWDARRRSGYLLVTPREKDGKEIRFRVEWE